MILTLKLISILPEHFPQSGILSETLHTRYASHILPSVAIYAYFFFQGYTGGGGVNWIDVDTVVYNKSLILTYNYAYGGATIDASLVPPSSSTILTLTDQVNEFLSGAATKPATAAWTSTNALFSFWIGINDIGNSWSASGNRSA